MISSCWLFTRKLSSGSISWNLPKYVGLYERTTRTFYIYMYSGTDYFAIFLASHKHMSLKYEWMIYTLYNVIIF